MTLVVPSGGDDTAVLQAAINADGVAGVRTVIGGMLSVSAPTYLPSYACIGAAGARDLCGIKLAGSCSPLPFTMVSEASPGRADILIDGITIDGNRNANIDHGTPNGAGNQSPDWVGTVNTLVTIYQASNVRLLGVRVVNAWGSGIWLTDCTDGVIDGCCVKYCRQTGIAARGASTGTRISGNRVQYCDVGIQNIGGSQYLRIYGNDESECHDSWRFPSAGYSGTWPNVWPSTGGFKAYSQSGYVSPARSGDGSGIEFTDPASAPNAYAAVVGNICRGGAVGLRVEAESAYVAAAGNVTVGNAYDGHLVYSGHHVAITGAVSTGNNKGVRMANASGFSNASKVTVDGCELTGNGTAIYTDAGLSLTDTGNIKS